MNITIKLRIYFTLLMWINFQNKDKLSIMSVNLFTYSRIYIIIRELYSLFN